MHVVTTLTTLTVGMVTVVSPVRPESQQHGTGQAIMSVWYQARRYSRMLLTGVTSGYSPVQQFRRGRVLEVGHWHDAERMGLRFPGGGLRGCLRRKAEYRVR